MKSKILKSGHIKLYKRENSNYWQMKIKLHKTKAIRTSTGSKILYEAEKKQEVSLENRKKYNIGTLSNPIFAEMYKRHAIATGSLILGSDLILNKKSNYVFSPGSGAHHGKKNKASGFCLSLIHI